MIAIRFVFQHKMRFDAGFCHILFILILFVAFSGGCAVHGKSLRVEKYKGQIHHIEGVPFFPQSQYQCGPSALAGILNYYGEAVSADEISGDIYRKDIRGTVSLDLALYPRKRGFSSEWYIGSIEEIEKAIANGRPIIVMVDKGVGPVKAYHFMVITGYTPDGLIVNSGKSRRKVIPRRLFLHQWEKTSNWTLLVIPKVEDGGAGRSN